VIESPLAHAPKRNTLPTSPTADTVDFDRDLAAAGKAAAARPDDGDALLRLAECQLYCGQVAEALQTAEAAELRAGDDIDLLRRVAEFHVHCGRHEAADRCHQRLRALRPDDPAIDYAAAATAVALGRMEDAERLYERVIQRDPGDYDALQNRSTLRRQTADRNHVSELTAVLETLPTGAAGRAPVHYALGKELEDLGEYDRAFGHYREGAEARRARLAYDVATDEQVMARIEAAFDPDWLRRTAPGDDAPGPIFILGLPRTGTTLLERMLTAHPQVASLGETNTLLFALMQGVGAHRGRDELLARAAEVDVHRLGATYQRASRGYGLDGDFLVDKTPLNFLYMGLIHRALPGARVIHLRRHPVDACFAMYKTLFRMGYPFSYRFQDIGRYYLAYHRLLGHWREVLPEGFIDVDYEALVTDTEPQLRRILDWVGLAWDDNCLQFHRQSAPVATASAAQVRQPVYTDSVNRWRRYERYLAPLAERLRQHGVPLG